jgi:predicted amidophosphoribosyltransferase
MATVGELSDPYALFMRNPQPPGTEVCEVCRTFTSGYSTCYKCGFAARYADLVVPISYSEHFGQLHTSLRAYKRAPDVVAGPLLMQLAAVLWRFLAGHEACLARAAGVARFDLVTTVPSGAAQRDDGHPLRRIVADVVGPTRDRHERLLRRSNTPVAERTIDPLKYSPTSTLDGESVLLVDDTWTTGASAQSAAGALKTAGAGSVVVLPIGRHVNPEYQDNAARLRALPPFSWDICGVHGLPVES